MAILFVYPDLLRALRGPSPCADRLGPAAVDLLAGLDETYGQEGFGPTGAAGALQQAAPHLVPALAAAAGYALEPLAGRLLQTVAPLLPGASPDLYLGTLLFIAPAGTLSIRGRPAIALGLERFCRLPPPGDPKYWYDPAEVVEMIPHEAAHAARMSALALPPTPRQLSLLEMVMLEGTALIFTDLLLGRQTLATFMPTAHLKWHEANDNAACAAVARDFDQSGMAVFRRYFSADSAVSGYYVGYSLCRRYLQRYGTESVRELLALPSREVLVRLRLSTGGP